MTDNGGGSRRQGSAGAQGGYTLSSGPKGPGVRNDSAPAPSAVGVSVGRLQVYPRTISFIHSFCGGLIPRLGKSARVRRSNEIQMWVWL